MNRFQYFLRRRLSTVLSFSISDKLDDFILWPLAKRLFKKYVEVVAIKSGLKMRVYGDMEDMVNKTLLFSSEKVSFAWEPGTARLVEKLSVINNFAIVAGSHIGYYPLIIGYTNPKCSILAFEPNPNNRKRCTKNVDLNNLKNITVIGKALGKKKGRQKMYFDFGQSSFVESARKHHAEGVVDITTLDSIEELSPDTRVLMLLDAEGYEKNIIDGGLNFISKYKPTIIFELNQNALLSAGSSADQLCNLLKGKGYKLFIINEGSHKISFNDYIDISLVPYEQYIFEGVSFVNAIAIIDSEIINKYVNKI